MPLSPRAFLLQLIVIGTLLGATNGLLLRRAGDTFVAKRLRSLKTATASAPTLLLGSSVMAEGVDPATFAANISPALRPAANLGLHASTPAEHYQLLATALRFDRRPRLLVYGYFGVELVHPVPFDWSSLTNRRAMIYATADDVAASVLSTLTPRERLVIRLTRPFPILTQRDYFWQNVDTARRFLDRIGLPPLTENRMGRAADMHRMAEVQFQAGDMRAYRDGKLPLSPFVAMTIDLARRRGLQCVFVEMPLQPAFRREAATPLHADFIAKLHGDLAARGCRAFTAFDWITDPAAFVDEVHLNETGRRKFTERLAAALAE